MSEISARSEKEVAYQGRTSHEVNARQRPGYCVGTLMGRDGDGGRGSPSSKMDGNYAEDSQAAEEDPWSSRVELE